MAAAAATSPPELPAEPEKPPWLFEILVMLVTMLMFIDTT